MILPALAAKLAPGYILAAIAACPAMPPPVVTIDFKNVPPVYDTSLTSAQLGRFHIDTTFSHGPSEIFHVGGLTESRIMSGFGLAYKIQEYPDSGEACLWTEKVEIRISYEPLVRISKDYAPGSCLYDTTARHELRHVNTDIITINEYIPAMKKAVAAITAALGPRKVRGEKGAKEAQDLFLAVVRTEMEKQAAELNRVRLLRQQQIDTRQEYLRLGKSCAHEKRGKR